MGFTYISVPQSVPESVQEALKKDLLLTAEKEGGLTATEIRDKQEDILFCEPPTFSDGLLSVLFGIVSCFLGSSALMVFIMTWGVLAMYTHLPVLGTVGVIVISALLVVLIAILVGVAAIRVSKFHFYGYKVITNHRIALVIPNQSWWIGTPQVASFYLKANFKELAGWYAPNGEGQRAESEHGVKPDALLYVFHRHDSARGYVCCYPCIPTQKPPVCFKVQIQQFEEALRPVLNTMLAEDAVVSTTWVHKLSEPFNSLFTYIRSFFLPALLIMYVAICLYLLIYIATSSASKFLMAIMLLAIPPIFPILRQVYVFRQLLTSYQSTQCQQYVCYDLPKQVDPKRVAVMRTNSLHEFSQYC